MASPRETNVVTKAGVFEGHTPPGYTELTVVDHTGQPLLRLFATLDVAARYELDALAYEVLDREAHPVKVARPKLRVVR